MKTSKEFKEGKNDIYWVGSNFKENFYNMEFTPAKVEGLQSKPLPRRMNDAEISKELAPDPVTLGDVLAYLTSASHDDLYLFYVKDAQGVLWAVQAVWRSGRGWVVGASSVSDPDKWSADLQVVSRRFLNTQTPETLNLGYLETLTARVEAIEAWQNRVMGIGE